MPTNHYQIIGEVLPSQGFVLSDKAMAFLVEMERFTRPKRKELLEARQIRQAQFDKGLLPDFLEETKAIREGDWILNNTPADLVDRRIEITGPVERKMIINALNSGANVFMADFEDSNAPTWKNCLEGQVNLFDAVRKQISYTDSQTKKQYQLNSKTAVLMVRPRGWHLEEAHVLIDEQPISASLFDALLYLFHNAEYLIEHGTGPYFYLPKLESHLEARLWSEVFHKAEELLHLPKNNIKVTVLIETITATFEMDEIIYELRDYIVGLNCGRWDYIFSYIKKFSKHPHFLLPDRQSITMNSPFLSAYVHLLIKTCHKRNIHAMGGMAAQIPIKGNEEANNKALQSVYADKKREVLSGHDGTWVAHPGLIATALDAFNQHMPGPNQLSKIPSIPPTTRDDLLAVPKGEITEIGVRSNLKVALLYLESWLRGQGCVPINNLMEDAATAEIARAQLWQWLKCSAPIAHGPQLTSALLHAWLDEEYEQLLLSQPNTSHEAIKQAKQLLEEMIFNDKFDEFLTNKAYSLLIQ